MPPKKPLPRVPYLKTKKSWNAQQKGEASCLPALTNLLNCWASYEEGAPQCAKLAQDLKDCMTKKRVKPPATATPDFVKLLKRVNPPPHD